MPGPVAIHLTKPWGEHRPHWGLMGSRQPWVEKPSSPGP